MLRSIVACAPANADRRPTTEAESTPSSKRTRSLRADCCAAFAAIADFGRTVCASVTSAQSTDRSVRSFPASACSAAPIPRTADREVECAGSGDRGDGDGSAGKRLDAGPRTVRQAASGCRRRVQHDAERRHRLWRFSRARARRLQAQDWRPARPPVCGPRRGRTCGTCRLPLGDGNDAQAAKPEASPGPPALRSRGATSCKSAKSPARPIGGLRRG